MAMTSVCQKSMCIYQDCRKKGLCLQLKRSGTKYAAQKINFLTSAVANGRSLPLWKVSLGSDQVLMSYYLFIFSSHQHVQHMTSQILLILIDFDNFFEDFLIWNYSSYSFRLITLELEEILRNGKRRSSWFLLLIQIRQQKKNISFAL